MIIREFTDSPIGQIEISAQNGLIISIQFIDEANLVNKNLDKEREISSHLNIERNSLAEIEKCKLQLKEYFQGTRKSFAIKLNPIGTDFQMLVWNHLSKIPYGETASYVEIAKEIKKENASRAVGAANGKNPIAILIPCHRVIGKDGSLTGYAGGLWRKKWLLNLEKNLTSKDQSLFPE